MKRTEIGGIETDSGLRLQPRPIIAIQQCNFFWYSKKLRTTTSTRIGVEHYDWNLTQKWTNLNAKTGGGDDVCLELRP